MSAGEGLAGNCSDLLPGTETVLLATGSGLGLLACFCLFVGSIFVCFEIVSHCISSWPRTCYVDRTGFELWDLPASEHCS